MKAKATELFEADQFAQAFPLYSQLLSLDPENIDFNYRFGVCLLYIDRANTEEPIKYLEKAINKVADIDLYYHLAVAYHNNYFFTDALYNYRKYLQLAQNNARKDYDVNRKIEMCQNGIEMLKAVNDLYVMQNTEVDRKAFYRSYNLNDFGGRIINLPEEFLSKSDLKNKDDKVTFFNPKAQLLFYALNNKNQKDIYYRIRQKNGDWSQAILLGPTINTSFDEDNPYLLPDGKTLYFSSKGHNTMGGYDIFRSVYDSVSKQWGQPVNLSFPFNTPSDDILFIPDAEENSAWFASNRNSTNNKIKVYKVGIIKKDPQSADLADVFDKENLSSSDLGKIKNMAQLDINISDKQFREIPVDQKHKLDALLKNEATRITQNIHQANLINVDKQIAAQEMQSGLNDSIKNVIDQIDHKLETLKTIYLQTQGFVSIKAGLAKDGYTELSQQLEKAQKTAVPDRQKELIGQANKTLFKTLRLDEQLRQLNAVEHAINGQMESQRNLLDQANIIFGDIQKNIVTRNDTEAEKYIRLLNQLIQNADTLTDYTKVVDFTTGDLISPKYPANLLDENAFAVYTVQNEGEYLSPIVALDTKFATYIPEIKEITELDLLKQIENRTSAARLKSKKYAYQIKLLESLINERKQVCTQLLFEASQLVKSAGTKPTAAQVKLINSKFAQARRAAFDTQQAQEIYDSLLLTSNRAENIAEQLSSLKSRSEQLLERGESKEVANLATQVEELSSEDTQLPVFDKAIDFDRKTLININYPEVLKSIDSYTEYDLKQGKLQKQNGDAIAYKNVDDLMASNNLLFNESSNQTLKADPIADSKANAEPKTNATQSNNLSEDKNNPSSLQIRESLAILSQNQTERLNKLKQLSILLTEKADEKLNASNRAMEDFERMREQYNNGQISDQKSILAKQTESQNLLYQSLALKVFAEKTDSIIQSEQKLKEESTNQIFAIEQALQSDQPEKAQSLFRVLNKTVNSPKEKVETLIPNWIEKGTANISKQKTQANQAFENSQKLTDASIQLLVEAQKIRKDAQNKTNAFKQREIELEAEKKETLAVQKQNEADNQLAIGTNLYEGIKKAEAIQLIANEFPAPVELALNTNPASKPVSTDNEANKTQITPDKVIANKAVPDNKPEVLNNSTKPASENILPETNDLLSYETKRYKAQLLADELDINKKETEYYLETGKTLSGSAARENKQKIADLQKEAESLKINSAQALIEAENSFKQLPAENRKQTDNQSSDFDNYLKNVRDRIAQLLDDVTKLSDQASATKDVSDRENLIRQADEKEKIASYLILNEYEIIAQRNKQNSRKNNLVINTLLQENKNEKEKELVQTKIDQIDSYLRQATEKYMKAKSQELSFSLKKALLQDAFVQETKALEMQSQTISMLRDKEQERKLAEKSNNNKQTQTALQASKGNPIETSTKADPQTEKIVVNHKNTSPEEKALLAESRLNSDSNPNKEVAAASDLLNEAPKAYPNVRLGQEPEGTRYSVQIAAIGGLKTIDNFMNVIELFALKDKQRELYRYFSGNFSSLKAAIIRRNSLRLQGYADAFIKSWKDGKEVSILEANGNLDEETNNLLNENVINLPYQYRTINFSSTNISQLTGVYYSVQIGVFSRPRSSAQLLGIKPLYHNRMKNGNWVYYNGIFKSIADAEVNKDAIHTKGIPDAFVVAFKDGEKVSFTDARKALKQGLKQPADEDIIILEDAANSVDEQLKTIIGTSNTPAKKIYKIQIGVYSNEVPLDWVSTKLGSNNPHRIEYFINKAGKYVYTIGSFNTYEEAAEFNTKELKKIISDAFIVVFENGNKI